MRLIAFIALSYLFLVIGIYAALAHSNEHGSYTHVYEFNNPGEHSQLCCGGDPQTGDCEALTADQIVDRPDGGVTIMSQRYNAQVFVPKNRIEWTIPLDTTTQQPAFPHDPFMGHWCGARRGQLYDSITERQQDPNFLTYCAFIKQGGV